MPRNTPDLDRKRCGGTRGGSVFWITPTARPKPGAVFHGADFINEFPRGPWGPGQPLVAPAPQLETHTGVPHKFPTINTARF